MDTGIVYHIETAQQFWAELEDILHIPPDSSLEALDQALETFITVCANNHERFLQTNAQLEHACAVLLDTELFGVHSQRSTERVLKDALISTDPHAQLVRYRILNDYGVRSPSFFRSLRVWSALMPLLMDHILVEIYDPYFYAWGSGGTAGGMGLGIPIEARLRGISVALLYEVCRVQKIDPSDLRLFSEDFINYLFELVEETRSNPDETLNYALIKLIVALNEQFMVAALPQSPAHIQSHAQPRPHALNAPSSSPERKAGRETPQSQPAQNRVLKVLLRRLDSSKTFGENLIFMLNRADDTPEDLCMQLLVLKLLYLLFTTPGTQEYFYTNDLRVLVDVFMRELVDLPEERESLRHTYLRVLHPLLVNTQLKTHPYKRLQVLNILQSLVAHAHIREVSPTTVRLVDRCLRSSWCTSSEAEQAKKLTVVVDQVVKTDSNPNAASLDPGTDDSLIKPLQPLLHKAASADLAGHGHGLTLTVVVADAGSLEKGRTSSERGGDGEPNGRPPRSADPTTTSYTYKPSLGRRPTGRRKLTASTSTPLPTADGISETSPTDLSSPDVISPTSRRPRANTLTNNGGPNLKDKSAPPPPRPPPMHRRRSSEAISTEWDTHRRQSQETYRPVPPAITRHKEPPTRENSFSEITRSTLDDQDETYVKSLIQEPKPQRPQRPPVVQRESAGSVGSVNITVISTPSSTPPPKHRRRAPPVPTGGRRTGALSPTGAPRRVEALR
ncbi:hypothetical protein FRB96_005956 [Tulasnella sp. 330]|nr:hypothetical protein FRB96_005956 [Tulasnella sp. 330]